MAMKFISLWEGNTMDDATILAMSADRDLVNLFARRLMVPPGDDNGFQQGDYYYKPRSQGFFLPETKNGTN
jgi:hypothetical protein